MGGGWNEGGGVSEGRVGVRDGARRGGWVCRVQRVRGGEVGLYLITRGMGGV